MFRALRYSVEAVQSLFYPNICAGCGIDLHDEEVICISCLQSLPITNYHLHASNPVEKIFWGRVPLLSAFSYLYFNKHSIVRSLLHQLKYESNKEVGYFFGRQIGTALRQSNRYNHVEMLIPLPLHDSKMKKRGYNQAEIICQGISEVTSIPVNVHILKRPSRNETQTHKSRIERWQNTSGKFQVSDNANLQGKEVLLIDDVVTTGATLEASAVELVNKGAKVSIGTLAYTNL